MAYLYNIYKDEKLILEKATTKQVSELTGCNRNSVSRYAKRQEKIKGIYTLKIVGEYKYKRESKYKDNPIYKKFAETYGAKVLAEWLVMNQKYGTH